MSTMRQFPERAKAICGAGLTREATVGELSVLLARQISADGLPGILVVDPAQEKPHEFRVWRGAQTMIDGLRALMRVGIWPGPADIPSVTQLMTERFNRSSFATTLWGEGARDEGLWAPLWRERDIRHGMYIVARGSNGEIMVGLYARRGDASAFSERDLANAESIIPYFTSALDEVARAKGHEQVLPTWEPVVGFSNDAKIESLGEGALEILSYAGGGTTDAVAAGRAMVEAAVARQRRRTKTSANEPEKDAAKSYFKFLRNPGRHKSRAFHVADTAFGRIDIRLSVAADAGGGIRSIGALRLLICRRLATVRALIDSDVPSREFALALALEAGQSLPGAARSLGLALETVKTLDRRLRERFDAVNREALLSKMAEAGARALR